MSRAWAWLFILVVAVLTGTSVGPAPQTAHALGITLIYDAGQPDAVDPCAGGFASCVDGVDPTPHLQFSIALAAEHWMDIIEDLHDLTVRYWWVDAPDPSAATIEVDDNGRPTLVHLRVPADREYYLDPFPALDDEFDMTPRLYRTLHPAEDGEAILGNPPEVFEISYNGLGPSADLFTILLHELGHGIGLTLDVVSHPALETCSDAEPYYHLDTDLVGGTIVFLSAFVASDGDPDCAHLDLGGITECKLYPDQDITSDEDSTIEGMTVHECTSHQALLWVSEYPSSRFRPSVADILAVATAANYQQIDLPRKYSLASGLWHDPDTWLGARVPDSNDDVFIMNEATDANVSSFEEGHARNILITGANSLDLFFEPFTVPGTIRVRDTSSLTVDLGAQLDTGRVIVATDALFHLAAGSVASVDEIQNFGTLRGATAVDVGVVLSNDGLIRSNGGELRFVAMPGAAFDLDGQLFGSSLQHPTIETVFGDIVFEGPLYDAMRGTVIVDGGYRVTFTEGWEMEPGIHADQRIVFNGANSEATIDGDSLLGAPVEVNGLGRFTDDATFRPWGRLDLDMGGPTTDRLVVDGHAELAGTLNLTLDAAYVPAVGDSFVLVEYGSHGGFFGTVAGADLGPELELVLLYGASELVAEVRLVGDINGDGELSPADIANLNQQLGACAPVPEPCPGDLDDDGDVDKDDRLILIDLLKAQKS